MAIDLVVDGLTFGDPRLTFRIPERRFDDELLATLAAAALTLGSTVRLQAELAGVRIMFLRFIDVMGVEGHWTSGGKGI